MTRCPSDARLVQLLEEQLDRRDLAEVERHLQRCGTCQESLEELTRDRIGLGIWGSWVDGCAQESRDPRDDSAGHAAGHPTTLPGLEAEPEPEPEGWECPRVEGYEILGRLGQGGMGVVYRARQHGLDRLVALKMIRAGSHAAPEHLARFRIEARAVARLRHPNVVQVYDIGQAGGLPFVALELLEGGSLESRIGGTPQPERDSAELLATLAGAVGAAHRAGVAHRDLKSANVLFDREGTPKVADFGLAKRLDEEDGQTRSGQVMGSPSFMAPEQALGRGRVVGPAADLYSLGAILYEMLTGRPPFKGASALETLYQVVHDDPVPPSRLRPGLSRDLETICLKCLEKEPRKRYAEAGALAEDLRRFLGGSPVLARRVGARERLGKWARRQPAAAALAGFALAVLAGLVVAGVRARQGHEATLRKSDDLGREGERVLDRAELALRDGRWEAGSEPLAPFLGRIQEDRRLAGLHARGLDLLGRLRRGLDDQRRREEARRRLARFARSRHQALLRDTQFTGVGQFRDLAATRKAARAALDEFAEPRADGEWAPAGLPASLTGSEQAEVHRGRHELLLIWADAVAQPAPGEDPRIQAERALRILDRALADHAPTRACHLLRADCRARLGDAPGTDRERQLARSIPAADAFGRVLHGWKLHRERDWAGAIPEFEEALRSEPGLFRAQLLLAVCQLQVGRPGSARANLTACLQREPGAISLHMLRGFAYAEEGHRRQKQARDSGQAPENPEALALFEAAEADFRTALAMGPDVDERYGLLVNRGALRIRSRRLDDAVADLAEAVALKPELVAGVVLLGQAYRIQGRLDEAIERFTRGIALEPGLPGPYRSRGLARLDRKRSDPEARQAALADLSEAIRREPSRSPEGSADRARRARLLLLAGRDQEALADAEAALGVDPADPDALLIRVKALLGLKRYAEVVSAADGALARGRPSAELFELRGLARADRQDFAGAIGDYTQALTLEPGRAAPLIHRGWAYVVSEAPRLALHDFDQAVRLAPENPEAYTGRGFARALHGQHRLAVADAEESLRLGGPDQRTAYNAARIYAKAAETAFAEAPRRNLGLARTADDYQDRAQALIRLAIERLPADRRAAFWRDVVQPDPALAAIRRRPKFSQLASPSERQAR